MTSIFLKQHECKHDIICKLFLPSLRLFPPFVQLSTFQPSYTSLTQEARNIIVMLFSIFLNS